MYVLTNGRVPPSSLISMERHCLATACQLEQSRLSGCNADCTWPSEQELVEHLGFSSTDLAFPGNVVVVGRKVVNVHIKKFIPLAVCMVRVHYLNIFCADLATFLGYHSWFGESRCTLARFKDVHCVKLGQSHRHRTMSINNRCK